MKSRQVLLLFIALISLSTFIQGKIKLNKDYLLMDPPIPALDPNKIEVIEAFSYSCPHCKEFEPSVQKLIKQLPNNVSFRDIHVFWAPEFMNLIRLNVAVDENHLREPANQLIFKAIFEDRINLTNEQETIKWLNAQTKFDGKKIAQTYQLPATLEKAKNISKLTDSYRLEATPTFIVGGKYKVNLQAIKTEADLFRIINELIQLVQKEKTPIKTEINEISHMILKANKT